MGLSLDIGCGAHKHPAALGADRRILPGVAVVCDLEQGLPFREGSVMSVYLHNIVEHMDDLIVFMEELYRVREPGAKVYARAPWYASCEALVDSTHVRYITEATFEYFDCPNYYGLKTNFKVRFTYFKMRGAFWFMPAYFQKRFRRYLWNACTEIDIELEAIKPF